MCGIFEFWFLECPFLFLSFLDDFFDPRSSVKSYMIRTWFFKSLTHWITCIRLEKFRSKARISWNLSLNLTDLFSRRHSNNHKFVFLVPHPDLYGLISLHQCTSVESGMIFLSAHTIEPSVQHDDDKWNHLEWNLFVTGNTNYPSFWYIRTSFAFSLLTYISDSSNLSISSMSAIRTSPFEIPVAIKA